MATYQKNEDITFVNPYTFVPLSDDPPYRVDGKSFYKNFDKELISGFIQCHITTKTPLAIPDVSDKDKKNNENGTHQTYDFFTLGGEPAIPGSSIRGVIRSVHETLTNSCYVTSDPKGRISIRVDPKDYYNPGLLIRNAKSQWELYEAESYAVGYKKNKKSKSKSKPVLFKREMDHDKHEWHIDNTYYGDKVTFSEKNGRVTAFRNDETLSLDGYETLSLDGYLYIGETFSKKYSEQIFKKGSQVVKTQEEIDFAIERLKQSLKSYRDKGINKNFDGKTHLGYPGFDRAFKNGIVPIWYKDDIINGKNYLSLSLACLGRKQFLKNYEELLKGHGPCKDRKSLCPSCLLFGMVGDKENDGIGSRIRVTDASLSKTTGMDLITLKELGTPRPSYLPFYSKNGESYDSPNGGIRGRKYYWHNPKAKESDHSYKDVKETKRNATMQVMKPGAVFDFKIYFDQITQEQLDILMGIVTLGKDTGYCHKIGHGKPLGLGSVKMTISQVAKKVYRNGIYHLDIQEDPDIAVNISEKLKDILACPADLDDTMPIEELRTVLAYPENPDDKIPISYPWVGITKNCKEKLGSRELKANVLASHQWFNEFKKVKGILPEIIPMGEDPENNSQKLYIFELEKFDENNDLIKKSQSKHSSASGKGSFEKNKEYSGTVKSYKKDNNVAVIILDNEKEATIHFSRIPKAKKGKIDKQLPIKQKVTLKYLGKNSNGYDDWSFVEYN